MLNPKTLDAFKNSMHFEEVEVGARMLVCDTLTPSLKVDSSTAYLHDKRDMWTLQKQRARTLDRPRSTSRAGSIDSNCMVMQRQSTMNRKLSGIGQGYFLKILTLLLCCRSQRPGPSQPWVRWPSTCSWTTRPGQPWLRLGD